MAAAKMQKSLKDFYFDMEWNKKCFNG